VRQRCSTGGGAVRPGRTGAPLAWLSHPVTLLSVGVLVVNDHILKAYYPGLVTGKLSDVAGLVVAPPLLATVATLLVPRLSGRCAAVVAVVATGIGFTAVNISPLGAEVASHVWSVVAGPSRTVADATDLLTLPALALSWWVWRRVRRRPAPFHLVRMARMLMVLPAALLAVAATSLYYPEATVATEWEGGLAGGSINGAVDYEQVPSWQFSSDGGRTWSRLAPEHRDALNRQVHLMGAEERQGCVPGEPRHCYRLVDGQLRVEESRDAGATWRASWEVTEEQRERLARHHPGLDDPASQLSSLALVVHATDAGHVVLVANARDGFAVRSEDGQWHRLGFSDSRERLPHWDDRFTTEWLPYGVLWGLVAAVLCALVVIESVSRIPRRERWRWGSVAGLVIVFAGIGWLFLFNHHGGVRDGLWVLGWFPVVLGLAGWLAVTLADRALSGRQWLAVAPGSILIGTLVALPLTLVSVQHQGAIAAAVLLWGAGTAVTATTTWYAGSPPRATT
jgi:hypothetical protein